MDGPHVLERAETGAPGECPLLQSRKRTPEADRYGKEKEKLYQESLTKPAISFEVLSAIFVDAGKKNIYSPCGLSPCHC